MSRRFPAAGRLLASACLTLLLCGPAAAQTQPEDDVRAVVQRLFDGMRAGDSTVVRAVFHPKARLYTMSVRNGVPALREDAIDGFVKAVGTPHEAVWDERVDQIDVRIDGPLASAWMGYEFYLGDAFSHCGVNAMDLFHGPEGWQIVVIADTRRREGCRP